MCLDLYNDHEEATQTKIKENIIDGINDADSTLRNIVRIRSSQKQYDSDIQAYYDEEEKRLIKLKNNYLSQLNDWSKKQDEWTLASKETFNFAHFARYWFARGDVKTKTWVLSRLGQNLVVKDGKLGIYGEKPYYLIEKLKAEVKQKLQQLEPNKPPLLTEETLRLPAVCLSVRCAFEKIRTDFAQNL